MKAPSDLERHLAGALVKTLWLRNRRGGPWQVPSHLPHRDLRLEGNTGGDLAATWFPAKQPRGAVVLAHPDRRYGRHWFVKEGYVDLLHQEGYDVLTFDFVGYGQSRGPATYYHEDVLAAARHARAWSGGFPVHVVGVSMGAFAVANASPKLDFVRSITLESPYPSFGDWYGKGAGLAAMRAFGALFPRTDRAITADLNIAHATPRRILVAWSDADEVTRPELSERMARAAPQERTQALRLSGAPHLGFLQRAEYREALLATLAGEGAASPQQYLQTVKEAA